jgi:disulfide bond formation protein DsbB
MVRRAPHIREKPGCATNAEDYFLSMILPILLFTLFSALALSCVVAPFLKPLA